MIEVQTERSKLKTLVLLFLVSFLAFFLISCNEEEIISVQGVSCQNGYVDLGRNLLYFCETGGDFGSAVTGYLYNHPKMEITAMAPENRIDNGNKSAGEISGYWVVVKEKS